MLIGKYIAQKNGYKAFILNRFPLKGMLDFSHEILMKTAHAERIVGKLDGITQLLPDVEFFINMFSIKDATSSAQIEGTKATIQDALEKNAGLNTKDTDADDILFYIKALNYGIERIKNFPFSLRLIRELHQQLLSGARSSHFADPGEFRRSQNWIGGSSLKTAAFVPPPVPEMNNALTDLEKFINDMSVMPVIQAGLIHAQFETIHPFLDGNGRTGRLLITLFFFERAVLERPVLFLSSYLKKHQQLYYEKLNAYRQNGIEDWLNFYLDGVIEVAEEGIAICKKINMLRENDMLKIQALGKREATSGVRFLQELFKDPITSNSKAATTMQLSRAGATRLVDRFVKLGILHLQDDTVKYGKTFSYKNYIHLFQ